MIISISQDVIASARWIPLLEMVVDLASNQRHDIAPDSIESMIDSDWVRQSPRDLGDVLKKMLAEQSYRKLSRSVVEICPKASPNGQVMTESTTRVSPSNVLPFLFTPFQVVLENEEFDGAFLLWMARALKRPAFIQAYRSGKFSFRHAGGKGSIDRSVRLLSTGVWGRDDGKYEKALSMWSGVVIDSDSKYPGDNPNDKIRQDVAGKVRFFHILRNRSIESYIPKSYMLQKVGGAGRQKVENLFLFNDQQRRHYHMKVGFKIDGQTVSRDEYRMSSKVPADTKALYAGISDSSWNHVADGFGSSLSSIFVEERTRPDGAGCINEIDPQDRAELEGLIDMITEFS